MTKLDAARLLVKSLRVNPKWSFEGGKLQYGVIANKSYIALYDTSVFISLNESESYREVFGFWGGYIVKRQVKKTMESFKKVIKQNSATTLVDIITGMDPEK